MAKRYKDKDIYAIIENMLDDKDEETGKTYRELIALQLIKTAAGKTGGARESVNAALSIVEKLEKRPKTTPEKYLDTAKEKAKLLEKYKVLVNEEG